MSKKKKTEKERIELVEIDYKKLKFTHTQIEKDAIIDLIREHPSFKNVFDVKRNYTLFLIEDMNKRVYGKIPRNVVITIGGKQGTGKTTLGMLVAIAMYPNFDVKKHLAFTNEELLDKIVENAERKAFFIRDENPYSLRHRSQLELDSVMETNREFQLSFIIIGVGETQPDSVHFSLESVDMDESNMVTRFAIKDEKTRMYRGAFLIALPKEKTHKFWKQWKIYSEMKTEFQKKVRERNIEGFNPTEIAMEFVKTDEFKSCFQMTKAGHIKVNKSKLKVEIFKKYPNFTNDERAMIQTEVQTVISTGIHTFSTLTEVQEEKTADEKMKEDLNKKRKKKEK